MLLVSSWPTSYYKQRLDTRGHGLDAEHEFTRIGDGQREPAGPQGTRRQAAEQGVAAAQFNIGVLYEFGNGLLEDDERAHLWFTIAAQQGFTRAEERRTILALRMTEAEIARADEMSLRLRTTQ